MKFVMACYFVIFSQIGLATVSFDFHHHFTTSALFIQLAEGKNRDYITKVQDGAGVEKTMLISDSYRLNYDGITDRRHAIDQELLEFLETNPDRFLGICSLDLLWPDVESFADKCTRSPLIKGVKLHFDFKDQSIRQPMINAFFHKILKLLANRPIFYLIHFEFEADALDEAKEIFQLARQYQKQNFIIAHAAEEHSNVLAWLGKEFRSHPELRQNVYTEISTTFTIGRFFSHNPRQVIQDWRDFGISNILFGSDFPVSSPKIVFQKLEESGLSPDEIQAITISNGLNFFETLK